MARGRTPGTEESRQAPGSRTSPSRSRPFCEHLCRHPLCTRSVCGHCNNVTGHESVRVSLLMSEVRFSNIGSQFRSAVDLDRRILRRVRSMASRPLRLSGRRCVVRPPFVGVPRRPGVTNRAGPCTNRARPAHFLHAMPETTVCFLPERARLAWDNVLGEGKRSPPCSQPTRRWGGFCFRTTGPLFILYYALSPHVRGPDRTSSAHVRHRTRGYGS